MSSYFNRAKFKLYSLLNSNRDIRRSTKHVINNFKYKRFSIKPLSFALLFSISSVIKIVDDKVDQKVHKKYASNANSIFKDNNCGRILIAKNDEQLLLDKILQFRASENNNNSMLHSINSDYSMILEFENATKTIVNENEIQKSTKVFLYWIEFNGLIRMQPTVIEPNSKIIINSFITHPFIITNAELKDFNNLSSILIGCYIPENPSFAKHKIIISNNNNIFDICAFGINEVNDDQQLWTMESYTKHMINGFTIYAENDLFDNYPAMKHILKYELHAINEIVPSAALEILHSTPIWINGNYKYYNYCVNENESDEEDIILATYVPRESMCFHPDSEWLEAHGNMSEKAECVEIYRCKSWIKERGFMPFVLLHELSHAFHWYLDFHRSDVCDAYQNAMISDEKLYQDIEYILGGKKRAYALTNEMEYFAELSESYFGLNDFYPFTRKELEEYDPIGFEILHKLWNLNEQELLFEHEIKMGNDVVENN